MAVPKRRPKEPKACPITKGPDCSGDWPGAKLAPDVAKVIEKISGIGEVRARCNIKDKLCVVEFDRVPESKHHEVAKALEASGYKLISASVAPKGPRKFGADVLLRLKS